MGGCGRRKAGIYSFKPVGSGFTVPRTALEETPRASPGWLSRWSYVWLWSGFIDSQVQRVPTAIGTLHLLCYATYDCHCCFLDNL